MTALRPRRLAPGDRIGIIAPSGPALPAGRLARGLEALRRMGYEPVVGPVAGSGASGAGPRRRAAEINTFVRDPTVRGIVAAVGGYITNTVLPYLDYDAWRSDPPILVGYSDITALHMAVRAMADVVTLHGPTLLAEFGEYPAPLPYTVDSWRSAVGSPRPAGVLAPAPTWTDEFLAWDHDDTRPRRYTGSNGWSWLRPGVAQGPLIGGNLETLSVLVGTRYLPSFNGAVLLCETTADAVAPVLQRLQHLRTAGVLDHVVGVLFARSFRAGPQFEKALHRVIATEFSVPGVPVVAGVDVGHTDPMLTLPLGAAIRLDATNGTIAVLEPAVT